MQSRAAKADSLDRVIAEFLDRHVRRSNRPRQPKKQKDCFDCMSCRAGVGDRA
jgi:hypothetical protein